MGDRRQAARHGASRLEAVVSRDEYLVRDAQRLRYRALERQMRRPRAEPAPALDADWFDAHCDHVIVRDIEGGCIVATYRVLAPQQARAAGAYHSERAFDVGMLALLRERMVEVGRICIHPDYPETPVMDVLWASLSRYLIENGHDFVLTTAAMPLFDGGHRAASVYRAAAEAQPSPEDLRVRPRQRLPLETLRDGLAVEPPPIARALLGLGAWVCGEPAVDPEFHGAMLPLLLPLARMRARDARQFLGKAA